jgi:hypothetical protein
VGIPAEHRGCDQAFEAVTYQACCQANLHWVNSSQGYGTLTRTIHSEHLSTRIVPPVTFHDADMVKIDMEIR